MGELCVPEFLLGNTLICTWEKSQSGRYTKEVNVNKEKSLMPSESYKLLAYGKFNKVGFAVDVQFVH